MKIQEYIELYYQDPNEQKEVLDLCLFKPLPKSYPLAENHPGIVFSIIIVEETPQRVYSIIDPTDKEIIRFTHGECNDELTAALDSCYVVNNFYTIGDLPVFFEFRVDRKFYYVHLPNRPIKEDFKSGKIECIEILNETDDFQHMLMKCQDTDTFAKLMNVFCEYCTHQHYLKNQPELNQFITDSVKTNLDIAEYVFFHK